MEPLPEELWQCWIGCCRIEQCNAVRFDVLVGYFRSSVFYQLYDAIEPLEKKNSRWAWA